MRNRRRRTDVVDLAEMRERALLGLRQPPRPPHPLELAIAERVERFLNQADGVRPFDLCCWYCGLDLIYPDKAGRRAWRGAPPANARTRDHQTPSSRGGRGGANIVACCPDCNTRKGNRTLEEFRAFERSEGRPAMFWAERVRRATDEEQDAAA